MTTTTSAGIEPADFAECSHSKTMPAGIEPAGLFHKTCHAQMYAIKKNTCNVKFHIGSWPVPIRLHVDSRDASTCWSNTCWSYSSLLDCRKHVRLGKRHCWLTTEIMSFALNKHLLVSDLLVFKRLHFFYTPLQRPSWHEIYRPAGQVPAGAIRVF